LISLGLRAVHQDRNAFPSNQKDAVILSEMPSPSNQKDAVILSEMPSPSNQKDAVILSEA